MPQLVTLQQAARNALAEWLTNELADDDVSVEPRWAEGDVQLPPKRVTIIDAGPRQIDWLQTEALATTSVDVPIDGSDPPATAPKVDAVWNFGHVTQPLQLDVWAQSDVELDDIIARLDASLNKSAQGLGGNGDPFGVGLLLPLANGWEPGIADFTFDEPVVLQSPTSVGEGEWRATYRGQVNAQMVQSARSPRMARILLKQRLRGSDPVNELDSPDVTPITPTS